MKPLWKIVNYVTTRQTEGRANQYTPNWNDIKQRDVFKGTVFDVPEGRAVTRLISCPGPGSTGLTLVARSYDEHTLEGKSNKLCVPKQVRSNDDRCTLQAIMDLHDTYPDSVRDSDAVAAMMQDPKFKFTTQEEAKKLFQVNPVLKARINYLNRLDKRKGNCY